MGKEGRKSNDGIGRTRRAGGEGRKEGEKVREWEGRELGK